MFFFSRSKVVKILPPCRAHGRWPLYRGRVYCLIATLLGKTTLLVILTNLRQNLINLWFFDSYIFFWEQHNTTHKYEVWCYRKHAVIKSGNSNKIHQQNKKAKGTRPHERLRQQTQKKMCSCGQPSSCMRITVDQRMLKKRVLSTTKRYQYWWAC